MTIIIDGETGQNQASGKTRDRIDEEVKRLTTAAYERAKVSDVCPIRVNEFPTLYVSFLLLDTYLHLNFTPYFIANATDLV